MADFDIDKWIRDSFSAEDANEYLYDLYLNSPSEKADVRRGFNRFVETTGIRRRGYSGAVLFPCLAIAAASLIFAFVLLLKPDQPETDWLSLTTASGETAELLLCDGTKLHVGPCSNIIYPDVFDGDSRKIFATGDIYMDVAKDAEKLFVVYSNGMEIKVHGTEFHLYSYPDNDDQEVALARGSISVSLGNGKYDVILDPGEMLTYNKAQNSYTSKTFNTYSYDSQMSGNQILFDNEDLETIARKLSNRFGAKILVCDESLVRQKYYASFVNGEGLTDIMESLGRQGNFSVKKVGDDYVLTK